jgi:hypothetical protein
MRQLYTVMLLLLLLFILGTLLYLFVCDKVACSSGSFVFFQGPGLLLIVIAANVWVYRRKP